MRRLTFLLVLVAFIFSCGDQWGVLQCLAWGNMIREYSAMVPLTEAVSMTFSGKYPCTMCKTIAEQQNFDQQQKVLSLEKYDKKFFCEVAMAAFSPTFLTMDYPECLVPASDWNETPPVPPPRFALS